MVWLWIVLNCYVIKGLAIRIHQRPTRISRIDGRICPARTACLEGSLYILYVAALFTRICFNTQGKPRTAQCCPCWTLCHYMNHHQKNNIWISSKATLQAKVAINSATKLRSIFPTVIVGSDPVLTPHQHWRSSHNLRGGRKTRDAWGTTTLMKIEVMTQGISNGHHQLPDTQFRGITQLHGRKWPVKTSNTGIYCSKETYHHTAETVFSSTFPTKKSSTKNPQYVCSPNQNFTQKLKRICQPAPRGNSQNPNIRGRIATNQLCLEHRVLITRKCLSKTFMYV